MIDTGISHEMSRQRFALKNSVALEFIFRYVTGLVKHGANVQETEQKKGKYYSFGIEYQLIRLNERYRRWTAELFYENGTNTYQIRDEVNVSSSEGHYKIGLNWYFYNYPSTIHRLLIHLGTRIGYGSANMSSSIPAESYKGTVLTFPTAHIGIKYRIKAGDEVDSESGIGLGLNALLQYEQLRFTSSGGKNSDTNGTFAVNDLKFSMGIGMFF